MRGATAPCDIPQSQAGISIHAPHAGSDHTQMVMWAYPYDFNPRSPCGERPGSVCCCPHTQRFQSTLPMRGATGIAWGLPPPAPISIHAPHAGSDDLPLISFSFLFYISIHAPHAGSDMTPAELEILKGISIHAPHAGSDQVLNFHLSHLLNFNPRSPCGERLDYAAKILNPSDNFNPRSPCGERLLILTSA